MLATASLKEIWLHTLHHLSVLRCGLALIDILVIVIAGKIVMASEVIVQILWLSSGLTTHIRIRLALHLLNYPVHELTGVLQPQKLLSEPLVVGT